MTKWKRPDILKPRNINERLIAANLRLSPEKVDQALQLFVKFTFGDGPTLDKENSRVLSLVMKAIKAGGLNPSIAAIDGLLGVIEDQEETISEMQERLSTLEIGLAKYEGRTV